MVEAIKNRRSVREYLSENIADEKIKQILLAATYSPSANAKYPWELIVVTGNDAKDKLAKVTPWSDHAKEAAAVIVVVGHAEESPEWIEDCSIVSEHIWLEATEQGLGSCWIQVRGNDQAEKEIKELLNIPAKHRVLCLMPLGVPAAALEIHQEDEFDKSRIKYEKYK